MQNAAGILEVLDAREDGSAIGQGFRDRAQDALDALAGEDAAMFLGGEGGRQRDGERGFLEATGLEMGLGLVHFACELFEVRFQAGGGGEGLVCAGALFGAAGVFGGEGHRWGSVASSVRDVTSSLTADVREAFSFTSCARQQQERGRAL